MSEIMEQKGLLNDELIKDIEAQRALMIAVATHKASIEEVNDEYKERRERISGSLAERGIGDPNPFSDLWRWYSKWKDGSLPSYQSRREFIADMYDPLVENIRGQRVPNDYHLHSMSSQVHAVENPSDVPFSPTQRLKVFLCHSSGDKPAVRELYHRLSVDGVEPWLDEENILPGQDWELEITKSVRAADVVIVCLSLGSATKDGFVQKEIRFALDKADEKAEGAIFIIPLKLEECDVPTRLQRWQWVNLFEERGYDRLVRALQARSSQLTTTVSVQRDKLSTSAGIRQMLDLEISHRITSLPILLEDSFTFTQLHTAKGSIHGKAEQHPSVGKLGEFDPLFSEFKGRSLFSLLWELRQIVAEEEKEVIGSVLESAKRLPYFFDKLILLAPVGEDDSKWQMDPKFLTQYINVLQSFDIGRWSAQLPSRAS
jgi:hypothetical protein